MKLEKSFLVECGWADVPALDQVLEKGQSMMEAKGIADIKYIEKLLRREFPARYYTLKMGAEAPLELAITAQTEEEQKNLAKAEAQIRQLLRSPVVVSGSLMPDACPVSAKEATLPVGGVVVADKAIIPAAHSSDICCSLHASFYQSELSVKDELERLKEVTRFGPGGRDVPVDDPVTEEQVWLNPFLKGLRNKAISHMADQGDGNHFAFLGELKVTQDLLSYLPDGSELAQKLGPHVGNMLKVLVTHHGSRSLGANVYKRGLSAAVKYCQKVAQDIPESAAWLDSESKQGMEYWEALQYVSRWTKANHRSIHQRFLEAIESDLIGDMGNEHNFVWQRGEHFYHGKGATPAWLDKEQNPLLGLIPLNMAQPILIVQGSDNQRYLSFAPHGAGRNLSRTAVLKKYRKLSKTQGSLDSVIAQSTKGLEVIWYLGEADLSETPVAYKDPESVKQQIAEFGLANVIGEIQPLGSIMAGRAPKAAEKPMNPKQKRQMQHRAERRKAKQRAWEDDADF